MTTFEVFSAAAGLPAPVEPKKALTLDQFAALLQTEAKSQGNELAEWLCREIQEFPDGPLKARMLDIIAEELAVIPCGTMTPRVGA